MFYRRTRTYIWDCASLTSPVLNEVFYHISNSIDHNMVREEKREREREIEREEIDRDREGDRESGREREIG